MTLFQPSEPPPEVIRSPRKAQPHDVLWDAVAVRWFGGAVADPHLPRVGKLVRDLLALGASQETLDKAVAAHGLVWPKMACTPESVVKHWNLLLAHKAGGTSEKIGAAVDRELRMARDRAAELEAVRSRAELASLDQLPADQFKMLQELAVNGAHPIMARNWIEANENGVAPLGQRVRMNQIRKGEVA